VTRVEDAGEREQYARAGAPRGWSPYAQPPPRCLIHGCYMPFRLGGIGGFFCRVEGCTCWVTASAWRKGGHWADSQMQYSAFPAVREAVDRQRKEHFEAMVRAKGLYE
jgi:hypothetical protein